MMVSMYLEERVSQTGSICVAEALPFPPHWRTQSHPDQVIKIPPSSTPQSEFSQWPYSPCPTVTALAPGTRMVAARGLSDRWIDIEFDLEQR